MAINKATLAKEIDGTIEYIYPKTVADIVEYDNSEHSNVNTIMSVQDKLDELHDGLATFELQTTEKFTRYYTSAEIDDIFYKPVTCTLSASKSVAEIGTSGSLTLSYSITRMTQLTSLVVNGETLTNPDTSHIVMEKTFSGSRSVNYASASASVTSQTFSMSVKDTATTNHSATTATKSVTLRYRFPIYYGIIDSPNTITAAQIVNSSIMTKVAEPSSDKGAGTYTFAANSKNGYLWFCCQSGYSVSFAVNGFTGGFEAAQTVTGVAVNSNITTSYKCYRSTNRQNASVTVVVS